MVFSFGENLTCAILAKKAEKIQIVKNFSVYSGDLSFRRFILSCRRGEIREARGIGIKFLRIITPLGYQTNPARAAHYNSTNRLNWYRSRILSSKTSEDMGFPDCGMAPRRR